MRLLLTEHAIATPAGTKRAVVATPRSHVVAGRAKLEELRQTLSTSALDTEIVEYVEARPPETFQAFVFCGRAQDGSGSWRFDADLTEDERFELGYRMWKSQLPLNRFCAAKGIYDNVYVEWTDLEIESFAAASEQMRWEFKTQGDLYPEPDTLEAAVRRLNLWIAERHAFFLSMPLHTILRRVLPPRFARLDGRIDEVRLLVEGLPTAALDGRQEFWGTPAPGART